MKIREIEPDDRIKVIALWEACGLTRPWNDPQRDLARAEGAADATLLVGEEDGAILATTMVGFDGHRGWLYYFAVAPDRQGSGLGRMLFGAAEGWLRSRGAPKLQLMVRTENRSAIGFYEALGLKPQPVVTLGKWLDHPAR